MIFENLKINFLTTNHFIHLPFNTALNADSKYLFILTVFLFLHELFLTVYKEGTFSTPFLRVLLPDTKSSLSQEILEISKQIVLIWRTNGDIEEIPSFLECAHHSALQNHNWGQKIRLSMWPKCCQKIKLNFLPKIENFD